MQQLLSIISPHLPSQVILGITFLVVLVGVVTFFFNVRTIYQKLQNWRKVKLEFQASLRQLKDTDYFIAHIIHLGGNFSMTYSMFVYSNEDGGFYFSPAVEFVSIGFNRGGDLMIVSPSNLAAKSGFKIDSISSTTGTNFHMQDDKTFCHVGLDALKNEYLVRFIRS